MDDKCAFPSANAMGMTLREYYAGLAMQGLLMGAYKDAVMEGDRACAAHEACMYADALIAALAKEKAS
jgi:hypothetical protein